jgi:Iron-containing alcohol dehydrogenase
MPSPVASTRIVLDPMPPAHFGAGAIDAVGALADRAGMTHRLADFGISAADFDPIATDALDDEVLANTPRPPAGADIRAILTGALDGTGRAPAATPPTRAAGAGPDGG